MTVAFRNASCHYSESWPRTIALAVWDNIPLLHGHEERQIYTSSIREAT